MQLIQTKFETLPGQSLLLRMLLRARSNNSNNSKMPQKLPKCLAVILHQISIITSLLCHIKALVYKVSFLESSTIIKSAKTKIFNLICTNSRMLYTKTFFLFINHVSKEEVAVMPFNAISLLRKLYIIF